MNDEGDAADVAEFQSKEKEFYRTLIHNASEQIMDRLSEALGYQLGHFVYTIEDTKVGGTILTTDISLESDGSIESLISVYRGINYLLMHELAHSVALQHSDDIEKQEIPLPEGLLALSGKKFIHHHVGEMVIDKVAFDMSKGFVYRDTSNPPEVNNQSVFVISRNALMAQTLHDILLGRFDDQPKNALAFLARQEALARIDSENKGLSKEARKGCKSISTKIERMAGIFHDGETEAYKTLVGHYQKIYEGSRLVSELQDLTEAEVHYHRLKRGLMEEYSETRDACIKSASKEEKGRSMMVSSLTKCLGSEKARQKALFVLSDFTEQQIDIHEAVQPLLGILSDNEDMPLACHVLTRQYATMNDQEGIRSLISRGEMVAEKAIDTLKSIAERDERASIVSIDVLDFCALHENEKIASMAVTALRGMVEGQQISAKVIDEISARFEKSFDTGDRKTRLSIVAQVVCLNRHIPNLISMKVLEKAIEDEGQEIRELAYSLVHEFGGKGEYPYYSPRGPDEAVPYLEKASRCEQENVRKHAMMALCANHLGKGDVGWIKRGLKGDDNVLKEACLYTLRCSNREHSLRYSTRDQNFVKLVPAIRGLLSSEDDEIKRLSIVTLADYYYENHHNRGITGLLASDDEMVGMMTAKMVVNRYGSSIVINALKSKDISVMRTLKALVEFDIGFNPLDILPELVSTLYRTPKPAPVAGERSALILQVLDRIAKRWNESQNASTVTEIGNLISKAVASGRLVLNDKLREDLAPYQKKTEPAEPLKVDTEFDRSFGKPKQPKDAPPSNGSNTLKNRV